MGKPPYKRQDKIGVKTGTGTSSYPMNLVTIHAPSTPALNIRRYGVNGSHDTSSSNTMDGISLP